MKHEIGIDLLWAGVILAASAAAALARSQGLIDDDTTVRVVALNGLMVAYYGNKIPKGLAPSAAILQAKRFAGWAMVISGLIYAAFWGFAPLPLAMTIGTGSVALGVLSTIAYCLWLRRRAKAAA